jgi:hypothetical protein
MDPKQFSWSEDQQVTVKNPTGEDFQFTVHSKSYVVEANTTAKMPGFMAWLYVYNLATKLAQEQGVFYRWNEEGFRPTFINEQNLVVAIDDIVQEVVKEEPTDRVETVHQDSDDDDEGMETTQTVQKRAVPTTEAKSQVKHEEHASTALQTPTPKKPADHDVKSPHATTKLPSNSGKK